MINHIIVAIGSNLSGEWGDTPYDMCLAAVEKISQELNCQPVKISRWYETSPIPPSGQPFYVNGVIAFKKNIEPLALLAVLNEIEQKAGRVRQYTNEARPLDLDIICIGQKKIEDSPKLVVPHPRAHLRGFVLYPLRDLFPDWVHPVSHHHIDKLIADLPPEQIVDMYHHDVIE